MSRRRRDRVAFNTGEREFYRSSGTLPRSADRDFGNELYGYRSEAVYPSHWRADERSPQFFTSTVVSRARYPTKPGRKARLSSGFSRPVATLRELPYRVRECVRRKDRREVLFAVKRAGYSGSAPKRSYIRKLMSNYGC